MIEIRVLLRTRVENRGELFRGLFEGIFLGGKTGTTQDFKDAWFIGYMGNIIIGVWVGRDDNKTYPGLFGGNQPALIFRGICEKILDR